ncbi:MAG: T9SS type A sorting domain-containing protein [Flavobacteriales bacterium]|nr:T9SS type A sorting domain-containing protein [Flavobacteriales bacterium]
MKSARSGWTMGVHLCHTNPLNQHIMKKHVPFLLSLLSVMALLAWAATVRAQCSQEKVLLNLPLNGNLTDISAYAHTVNAVGNPLYANGYDNTVQGAIGLGTGKRLTIPAAPEFLDMDDAFTISAWINASSLDSYNSVVTKLNGSHRDIDLRIHFDGKMQIHFTNSSSGITAVTSDVPVITTGTWYHVAATWDGNTMKLFVNGVSVKEMVLSEGPDFQSSGDVTVGALGTSETFNGYFDNILIRAYATPDDEIACLMNSFVPATNGVVIELPLDGGSATDISANGNNGTPHSATAVVDRFGSTGGAMRFNGLASYVVVPYTSAYANLGQEFTISAWVLGGNAPGFTHTIVSKTYSGRDIVLHIENGVLSAHYYVNGYTWCTAPSATFNGGGWSHVACTWDGISMTIYQDGNILQTITPATPPSFSTAPWVVGALTSSGGEYFDGDIDEVKVWDRALSLCELRSDIVANIDLVSEDNLMMCAGQTQTVTATSMCTYLWTADNSTSDSFVIDADNLGAGDHAIVLEAYDMYDNFYSDTVHVNVSLCTGIEEQENSNTMKLMPNPASSVVTVSATDLAEIQLMDVSGRIIQQIAVVGSKETNIDISYLPAGIYLVSAKSTNGTVNVERLMKR